MATCYREFADASARRLGVARFATVAVAAAISLVASTAEAATLEDIVKLTQVGVADTVLIELIDMNPTPYSLAPFRLRALRQAGVSEIVLLALLRNGFVEGVRNPSTDCLGSSFSCRAETPTAAAPPIPVPVPVPVRTPRRTLTQTRSAGPLGRVRWCHRVQLADGERYDDGDRTRGERARLLGMGWGKAAWFLGRPRREQL